jgi:Toxin SymE, type I toxin-antitoxin system
MNTRTLKIESTGDFCYGKVSPKIRLSGQWLERAGFKSGHRVEVHISEPGLLTLRLLGKTECAATPIPETQAGCSDILRGCASASAWAWQGVLELEQTNLPQHGTKPVRTEIRGQQRDRQIFNGGKRLG